MSSDDVEPGLPGLNGAKRNSLRTPNAASGGGLSASATRGGMTLNVGKNMGAMNRMLSKHRAPVAPAKSSAVGQPPALRARAPEPQLPWHSC